MEKKKIEVHAVTVHIYQIIIVVLLVLLAGLGFKYVHQKFSLDDYTRSTIWMNQQVQDSGRISDYGAIIAVSVGQYVPASDLQNYVSELSKDLNRDIVVLDRNDKILADSIVANKGTIYAANTTGEIRQTLSDGKLRTFEERSKDYPNGLTQVVLPVKNSAGEITGVVLISNTEVFH